MRSALIAFTRRNILAWCFQSSVLLLSLPMSDPKGVPPAENIPAIAASPAVPSSNGTGVNTSATAPKTPMADGNPAFRMMGNS